MRYLKFTLLALAVSIYAADPSDPSDPDIDASDKGGGCPAVWARVARELKSVFQGCGRDAHGAIRAPFHDCINNGCDGSLILTGECSRAENGGLANICTKLSGWQKKYHVGAADMIQFAAATAIATCPMGPRVRALVGRKDSAVAAAPGGIPGVNDSPHSILAAFSAKGFSADDLIALLGTHSVAVQAVTDPKRAGQSLDSTPSIYDTKFYSETLAGTAPFTLQSDKVLSNDKLLTPIWSKFASDRNAWASRFVSAWNRFSVIGNDVSNLRDCSNLI
ncbi:hypothetical protein ACEQ8H_008867 [Pleosporales sp. CAS-2024a]